MGRGVGHDPIEKRWGWQPPAGWGGSKMTGSRKARGWQGDDSRAWAGEAKADQIWFRLGSAWGKCRSDLVQI